MDSGKGTDKKPNKQNEPGASAKGAAFRGVNIAIGIRGDHAMRSTPGIGVLEIYGTLKVILTKMEKELLNQ